MSYPGRYLNKYHEQSEERLKAAISKQPSVSAKEAYAEYDRIKAGRQAPKGGALTRQKQKPLGRGPRKEVTGY